VYLNYKHSTEVLIGNTPEKSVTILLAQDPVRCKFIMVNKSLKQLKNFKYLGSEISYENEKYVQKENLLKY